MFDMTESFKVAPSKVVVTDIDGIRIRRIRFKLERDFDEATADGMGATAQEARELVADSRVQQVVIKLDAVNSEMQLKSEKGSEITIGKATGVKATATAPKVPKNEDEDEGPPTIKIEWECAMDDKIWQFLGQNAGDWANVIMRNAQLSLPLESAPPKGEGGGKNGGDLAGSLKSVGAGTTARAKGKGKKRTPPAPPAPAADPQAAATPEEAEAIRAQRLREESAMDAGVWEDADDKPEQETAGAGDGQPLAF